MKKALLSVLIVSLALLPMGCDLDVEGMIRNVIEGMLEDLTATYTIKVSSEVGVNATGLNVTGEYVVASIEYDPETDSMEFVSQSNPFDEEIEPGEYIEITVVDAIAVSAMFAKRTGDDTMLRVEIRKGEVLIDWEETTEPWGAVLVAAYP